MTPDTGILTALLNKFLLVFSAGPGNLQSPAAHLLTIIGAIEVTLAALWWALKGENVVVGILQKLLLLGLFFFFVESTFFSSDRPRQQTFLPVYRQHFKQPFE